MWRTVAYICSVVLLTWSDDVTAAGRALPIHTENYIIDQFQSINPEIKYDRSNFLVDLSGNYAVCEAVGRGSGLTKVDKLTPDGWSISGIVDSTVGSGTDPDSVHQYITEIVKRWMRSDSYHYNIRGAKLFGCSNRPGCSGRIVLSCLFSPGTPGEYIPEQPYIPPNNVPSDLSADIDALAFTREQYETAEKFTGTKWDRSHFLENLSGKETNCVMIEDKDWPFSRVQSIAASRGLRISALYGSERNMGRTEDALESILRNFKAIRYASEVGCSIIPHCMRGTQMYVVVSCLYTES
jgi:hypothetical protein